MELEWFLRETHHTTPHHGASSTSHEQAYGTRTTKTGTGKPTEGRQAGQLSQSQGRKGPKLGTHDIVCIRWGAPFRWLACPVNCPGQGHRQGLGVAGRTTQGVQGSTGAWRGLFYYVRSGWCPKIFFSFLVVPSRHPIQSWSIITNIATQNQHFKNKAMHPIFGRQNRFPFFQWCSSHAQYKVLEVHHSKHCLETLYK